MSDWTYHAQNVLTGAWITRDLQLRDVEITDVLTGHCQMTAVVAPEDAALTSGGNRLLEEWQTAIYAEKFNGIRFGGILTGSTFVDDGQEWHLTIDSFTAYANGEPYNRLYRQWDLDPLDAVREIWDFLQNRSNGNIGLTVDPDSSPVRVGDVQPPPRPNRADVTYPLGYEHIPAGSVAGDPWPRPPKPRKPKRKRPRRRKRRRRESLAHWNAYLSRHADRLARWKADKDNNLVARRPRWNEWHDRLDELRGRWEEDYGSREPYKLAWWEQPDCGEELERLAMETPFDWRERHTWNADKSAVTHRLQLGYPTIGVRHDTERLMPGVDLVMNPQVYRGGDEFANAVVAIGAGEGRKTRRASNSVDDDRLRRVATVTAKNARRVKRLEALAKDERLRRTLGHHTHEAAVWDTDGNLTKYRLGDEVAIDVAEGWSKGVSWHKIVGRHYRPDDDDVIYWQLVRAERGPVPPLAGA